MINPALTSYVLVDEHNVPVPLPYHAEGGTIIAFDPPHHANSSGRVHVKGERFAQCYFPHVFNLRIITENAFMAAQAGEPEFYLIDTASGQRCDLPYYLPDDKQVTSLDPTMLVVETTRSISWLEPAKYGLAIVAYCDLKGCET